MIDTLIINPDRAEVIRDEIAAVFVSELSNQQTLATGAGEDPQQWSAAIYTERANPFEVFLNDQQNVTPVVNIWIDNSVYDRTPSNSFERFDTKTTINIDIYCRGVSTNVPSAGHVAGDETAARDVSRVYRLLRNIIMSAEYTYLNMRGVVSQRWPVSFKSFQPDAESAIQNVCAGRFVLEVRHLEYSPQITPETLELISMQTKRGLDGQIILQTDYDYTT